MIDSRTLSAWFDAYSGPLALYARQWVDASRADDAVHDVFVSAMALSSVPDDPRAFLFRCVRNAAISIARSGSRRKRREETIATARQEWFQSRPEDLIDAKDAMLAIESLPQEQREVIVLRIWAELSFQQIAAVTGTSLTTAFDQYKRALAAARQIMEAKPCEKK